MRLPVVSASALIWGIAAWLAAGNAQAQWVYVARKALGRIEQVTQPVSESGPGYDAAAVMLEAPADKVWDAVIRGLRANTRGVVITQENPADHLVQFRRGNQVAGIKVSALSDKLTHLLVSSSQIEGQPDASALVLDSVLRVCREMNVACTPVQN